MSFLYFAYGSNMWPQQMVGRCPSAQVRSAGSMKGWAPRYDKPSVDGSAKLNITEQAGSVVHGAVYEIEDLDRPALDAAEPGYDPISVEVTTPTGDNLTALTYQWTGDRTKVAPYRWYLEMAQMGARFHGIPQWYWGNHLSADGAHDPLVGDLRPASERDLPAMQAILSEALLARDGRDSPHPGDLAWWIWHADPRSANHQSFWIQDGRAIVFLDSRDPGEAGVFAVPGVPRRPLLEWALHRLGDRSEVAFVAETDDELVGFLTAGGFERVTFERRYSWDVAEKPIPEPELPEGWVLRHVEGEHEADARRAASHSAFRSNMDEAVHLERYLRFMRSPVYRAERDLVAVTPGGQIASFIVWWPDSSGIAQIEPFGTDQQFQRQGTGRALMYYALRQMRDAGMTLVRVVTDEPRGDATGFYEGIGFDLVGKSSSWARPSGRDPVTP